MISIRKDQAPEKTAPNCATCRQLEILNVVVLVFAFGGLLPLFLVKFIGLKGAEADLTFQGLFVAAIIIGALSTPAALRRAKKRSAAAGRHYHR